MAVSKLVLGMNARNFLYVNRFNHRRAKELADDKLATKKLLIEHNIPTPKLLATFANHGDARRFSDWTDMPETFVLKPARGYGGEGIRLISEWDGTTGLNEKGEKITRKTLEAYIFDILDGAFSLHNSPDKAFCEDRLVVSSTFRKLTGGVPDIRIIVCNKVPIMAMLRLPTEKSQRKANLHLGALGMGIDLRTGITIGAIQYDDDVNYIPGTRMKTNGIKIPFWKDMLLIAARAQDASGLGYAGIDIVIDEKMGPLILEINARPGLSIQLANRASLRTRLERVAELEVKSPEQGVELSQQLFAAPELSDVRVEHNILSVIEKVVIIGTKKRKSVLAKIDTGAYRTSIDAELVQELGLEVHGEKVHVSAGSGTQMRSMVKLSFKLRDKQIESIASFTDRSHMRYAMIVGRLDLAGFLVDPSAVDSDVE